MSQPLLGHYSFAVKKSAKVPVEPIYLGGNFDQNSFHSFVRAYGAAPSDFPLGLSYRCARHTIADLSVVQSVQAFKST